MSAIARKLWTLALPVAAFATGAAVSGCRASGSRADYLLDRADAYRGGALWDTWWKVSGVKEPIAPGGSIVKGDVTVRSSLPATSPLYATNPAGNTRTGPSTWRCAECHGFDYKGKDGLRGSGERATGFPGVLALRDRPAAELFAAIRDGTGVTPDHAYGKVLSDQDVADLVKLVKEGLADTSTLYGTDGRSLGEAAAGKKLFDASCAACHGVDGKTINFRQGTYDTEYPFNVAFAEPDVFVHKVRFGQPDGAMPNGSVHAYYLKDVADILAYAQSLAPAGLETASAARGGVLYDVWWDELGLPEPADTNPLYQDPTYNTAGGTQTGSVTWQCAECHGFDYKGRDGAFATGEDATGIAGVMDAAQLPPADLIAIIGAGTFPDGRVLAGHAFGQPGMLSARDVADLALFVREGLVDDAPYISYATGLSKGNPVAGEAHFATNCAICHGETGMRINFAHDDPSPATEYVADLARDSPYELLHKIRFGRPGSDAEAADMQMTMGLVSGHMPNMLDAGYTEQDVADLLAYCQTLPSSLERGGVAFDTWWEAYNVAEPIEPGTTVVGSDGGAVASSLPDTNPTYLTNPAGNPLTGSDTWTCLACHGWDTKGKDGASATGADATGFPGVFAARDASPDEIASAIADGQFRDGTSDPNHAFGTVLGDWVVRDLVQFVQNTTDYDRELVWSSGPIAKQAKVAYVPYDPVLQPDGMKVRTRDASFTYGQVKFEANCARCHGIDGRAKNFAEGEGGQEYLGDKARDNPWNLLHTATYGEPGSSPRMPNAAAARYTLDDMADLLMYIQQLPGATTP